MGDCYVWLPMKLSWTKKADFLSSGENFIISIMIISVAEYDKKVCREGETNQSCGNTVTLLRLHRRPGCGGKK